MTLYLEDLAIHGSKKVGGREMKLVLSLQSSLHQKKMANLMKLFGWKGLTHCDLPTTSPSDKSHRAVLLDDRLSRCIALA